MGILRRLVSEIVRREPSREDAERAIAELRVRERDGVLVVGREGRPFATDEARADVVLVEDGVYATIPRKDARIDVLELAWARARERVELRVEVGGERTHAARAGVDAPRRLLRLAGVCVPAPGDRFGDGFVHRFFDEEELLEEIAGAGLTVAARRGNTFVLRPGSAPDESPRAFAVELVRAARLVGEVERQREGAPERAVSAMRALGRRCERRGPVGRARLRRAIGWVDAVHPGGPSCYRRILLELALDAGAAGETVVFGLDVGRTGHVAFKDAEERAFDVAFEIAP